MVLLGERSSPSYVELQFYNGQLVGIFLRFDDQENGDLIAVNNAVVQKYGEPNSSGTINLTNGSFGARQWNASRILMLVSIPDRIPGGPYSNFLKEKSPAAVAFYDTELTQKLSREKLDAARQEMLKSHDMEKIKADL